MLEHTFSHIPGIGPKTERRLWDAGILSWDRALSDPLPFSAPRTAILRQHVRESMARLEQNDTRYFYQSLSTSEQWRLFTAFRDSIAYLDIETTGLSAPGDHITTIALYDGQAVHTYVHGQNLHEFAQDIEQYKLLVTYNGKSFDVPFIRNDLGLPMEHAHIDLRYVLASLGYKGGLKGCEKRLGIDRGNLVEVDGYFAVLLWKDYVATGDQRTLDTLLAYNVLDVINLETLLVIAHNEKLMEGPFEIDGHLPDPEQPPNPFHADRGTIHRIKMASRPSWW